MEVAHDPGDPGDPPSFFDVALRQRACRQFDGRPVDDALVERCLTAATHAPSAENLQPWVFVVVRDAGQRAAVADLTRRVWREAGRPASEGRLAPGLLDEVDAGAETGLAGAPVLVVVCGDATVAHRSTLPSSVYPATQNLLLAANALGLGSARRRALRRPRAARPGAPDGGGPPGLAGPTTRPPPPEGRRAGDLPGPVRHRLGLTPATRSRGGCARAGR